MSLYMSKTNFKSSYYPIETFQLDNKFYFNIFDLSIGLNYNNPKYLYHYYYSKCNDIKIHDQKFIETNYVQIILNRSRKPNGKKLLQEILDYTNQYYQIILPNRIEIDIFNSIKDFFEDRNDLEIISNFNIDCYYPDIIIKKCYKTILIIEINEHNHKIKSDRMEYLKLTLKCEKFLNINPHDLNFSTGRLIKQIINLI